LLRLRQHLNYWVNKAGKKNFSSLRRQTHRAQCFFFLVLTCHHIPLSFLTFASESRVEGEEKSRKFVLRSVLFVCIFILLSTPSRPFVFCVYLVGSAHIQQLPRHISANERKFLPHFSSFACRYGNEPGVLTTSQIMKNIKKISKKSARDCREENFLLLRNEIFF
jgi:hypothetical protein